VQVMLGSEEIFAYMYKVSTEKGRNSPSSMCNKGLQAVGTMIELEKCDRGSRRVLETESQLEKFCACLAPGSLRRVNTKSPLLYVHLSRLCGGIALLS
jgi:hypothetical protein